MGGGNFKRVVCLSFALAGLALAGPGTAGAATVSPTPGFVADDFADNGMCSLREALEVANDNAEGDPENGCVVTGMFMGNNTVSVPAGSYVLDIATNEGANPNASTDLDVPVSGQTSFITGPGAGPGPGTAVIQTDQAPVWQHRVLEVNRNAAVVTVNDLTISGGNATFVDPAGTGTGGGIRVGSISDGLTLDGVRIAGNTAINGGGGLEYATSGGPLNISNSEFSGNTSGGVGGATPRGGGIAVEGNSPTDIDQTVISGNTTTFASAEGGGIYFTPSSTATITDSLIVNNTAADPANVGTPQGGGIRAEGSSTTLTIRRSTFSDNHVTGGASRLGAGISVAQTLLTLVNDTFSGNEALDPGGSGGGIHADNSTVGVIHSSVLGNETDGDGSAINKGVTGTLTLRGSIIHSFSNGEDACIGGGIATGDDNILDNDNSCGLATANDLTVADPLLLALGDYGGPGIGVPGFLEDTLTRPPDLSSPALDHVPAVDCDDSPSGTLDEDQRSFDRPVDSDPVPDGDDDCEAGSVEVYPCLGEPGGATIVGTAGPNNLDGTTGEDTIAGLAGDDSISGEEDDDNLCGGDGNDTLEGGDGDDTFDGGANPLINFLGGQNGDTVSFLDSTSGVIADMDSASGQGNDTLVPGSVETLLGSQLNDELTGDAGQNGIGAQMGDDQVNGLGGDDLLEGGAGDDELQFTGAPGPVTATLVETGMPALGSASGFGNDIHANFEDLSGGAFGDNLTGDSGENEIQGLAGADVLTGLGSIDILRGGTEADNFQAQDGVADTIDCTGGGADTGVVDSFETFIACLNSDGDGLNDLLDACPAQAGTLANGCVAPAATPSTKKKKCKKGFKRKKGKCKRKKRKK